MHKHTACMFILGVGMKVISEDKVIKVLDFIKDFQKKEGRSPSFRQIAKGCSFPSLATAQKYVAILQSRGMIEKNSLGKINIPRNLSKGKTVIAPLVGTIACGTPILAEENIEETFQLPTAIFGNAKSMLLRASGDSMTGVGINDGDLIVAEICDTADEGDIVVALLEDSATVKTLHKKNGHIYLHPENPKYKDILADNVIIQGIVKHNIHSF